MPPVRKLSYPFLLVVLALLGLGLLLVFSASPAMGLKHGDSFYYVKRHLVYLLLGFLAMSYGYRLDLENWKNRAPHIFAITVGLLLLVFLPGVGKSVLGASRWIDLGVFSFQPSELIKFSLVLLLAKWLADNQSVIKNFSRGLLPPLIIFGAVALLVMKQPDMGTTLTLGATVIAMLAMAGAEAWQLFSLGGVGVIGALVLALVSPYRLQRLTAYLNPWKDPQGTGFQIIQSLLAVGSGGILGLGLGNSKQKYFYLPQQFTDFIYAILCEELGLLGAGLVVILFMAFVGWGMRIALNSHDPFKRLLAGGIVSWLTIQALINLMVVVGIIPTTGIPLPFISFGGTATVINLFAVGIVLNVARKP